MPLTHADRILKVNHAGEHGAVGLSSASIAAEPVRARPAARAYLTQGNAALKDDWDEF